MTTIGATVSAAAEKVPKNRRKRTQAADKAVLEAAYVSNPKPDKSARLQIVRRVSMTEKEVQIWFQNRRQNDRRKRRSLNQHEIVMFRLGSDGMRLPEPDEERRGQVTLPPIADLVRSIPVWEDDDAQSLADSSTGDSEGGRTVEEVRELAMPRAKRAAAALLDWAAPMDLVPGRKRMRSDDDKENWDAEWRGAKRTWSPAGIPSLSQSPAAETPDISPRPVRVREDDCVATLMAMRQGTWP